MKKTAKILLICLLFTAIFITSAVSFAQRYDDVRSLFIPNGAEVSFDNGVKVVAREEGAGVTFRDDVSGTFSMTLNVDAVSGNGVKVVKVVYTDLNDTKNVITVCTEIGNKTQNTYTIINGKKYGIYYDNGVQAGKTLSQNAIGNYTITTGSNEYTIAFNPSTMKIVTSGRLTWDYSSVSVDGAYTGVTKEGFEKYSVSVYVDEINYGVGQFTIKNVNGTALSSQYLTIDTDKPAIFADVKVNALTDTNYLVPTPIVYDLCDGVIPSDRVRVQVVSPKGKLVLDENWTSNSKFLVEDLGEYFITYTTFDGAGNKGSIAFTIKGYSALCENVITYANKVREGEFGVGATHLIPSAICQNDMYVFDKEIIPYVEISKNGSKLYERLAKESFTYTFQSAGEYEIKYYVKERDYKIYSENYSVLVKNELPALSYVNISSEYFEGGLVEIPDANIIFSGKSAPANVTVITPSGKYIADKIVKLEEIGAYTIEYLAEIDNVQYVVKEKFNSVYAPEDLFKSSAGLSASFASHPYEEKLKGLLVTSGAGVEAVFNNVVKLDELTKEDLLIGVQAIPKQVGEVEYNKLYITLTDTENPANYIRINIFGNNWDYNSVAKVSFNGSNELGFNLNYEGTGGTINSNKTGGLNLRHSFKGLYEQGHDLTENNVDIYFDWEEKAIYASNVYNKFISGKSLLADLDNPEWIAKFGKEWEGFTNNTAYLSISFGYRQKGEINWYDTGIYYSSAQYIVTGAAGMDFSQMTSRDSVAPTIFVDTPQKVSNAVLNQKYKVFNAVAIDNMTEHTNLDVRVALNYGESNYLDVEIVDGYFTPVFSGVYEIIYTATDDFGNITTTRVPVSTIESASDITLEVGAPDSYVEGILGVLPEAIATGGVGNYTTEIVLTAQSGKVYPVSSEREFMPLESGVCSAVYTVKDYIGTSKTYTLNFNVADNTAPVFNSVPVMPIAMTAGVSVDIPTVTATDYGASTPATVTAKVYVKYPNDADFQTAPLGSTFIPDGDKINASGDKLVFKYVAEGASGQNSAEFEVPVAKMSMKNNEILPSNYFIKSGDDVSVEMGANKGRGVTVTAKQNGDYVIFGKKVLAKSFSVDFTINEVDEKNNITQLDFILVDSVNPDIAIKYTLRRNYKDNYLVIIHGNTIRASATLDKYSGTFSFDSLTNIGTLAGGQGKAIKCINGDDFNGFPSGYVFLKMVVADFRSEKVESYVDTNENGSQDQDEPTIMVDGRQGFFTVNGIGIQNFNSTMKDNVAPSIHVLGEYGGGAVVNTDYTIPRAIAGDILSTCDDVKVTVKNPSGGYVKAIDGTTLNGAPAVKDYKIRLSVEGTYTIQYQIKDANGNAPLSPPVNLLVKSSLDRVPVTLSYNGVIPETAKINAKVVLPIASVVGSNAPGTYVVISVFDPSRKAIAVTGNEFTPITSGDYVVVYMGYDSNGNSVVERFDLKVNK